MTRLVYSNATIIKCIGSKSIIRLLLSDVYIDTVGEGYSATSKFSLWT